MLTNEPIATRVKMDNATFFVIPSLNLASIKKNKTNAAPKRMIDKMIDTDMLNSSNWFYFFVRTGHTFCENWVKDALAIVARLQVTSSYCACFCAIALEI